VDTVIRERVALQLQVSEDKVELSGDGCNAQICLNLSSRTVERDDPGMLLRHHLRFDDRLDCCLARQPPTEIILQMKLPVQVQVRQQLSLVMLPTCYRNGPFGARRTTDRGLINVDSLGRGERWRTGVCVQNPY